MKKIISILSLIALILSIFSLISCKKKEDADNLTSPKDNFNIAETREIVLGRAVDSVVFTTRAGEKVTFDNTADFYEIYDKVGVFVEFETGKKYSYISEIQFENQSQFFTNANVYYIDDAQFYEFRTKKEGKDAVSVVERYLYSKRFENQLSTSTFEKIIYGDDKAFYGVEYNKNVHETYESDSYPKTPILGSELNEMYIASMYPLRFFSYSGLFYNHSNFEIFVTREYALYENYIVFKQTAPFSMANIDVGRDPDLLYALFSNTNCSITQEAYYNVKTGELELIKMYGNTSWHMAEYWGKNVDIDMQIYVHDINKSECEQKINNLIDYVKSNSDQ